jgi:hypothetical protein
MQPELTAAPYPHAAHPVGLTIVPALTNRNRLTCAFRVILAIPHIILVGGPIAFALSLVWRPEGQPKVEWGSAGVLGAVAAVSAVIAWFAIVFGARHPEGLWKLGAYYMHWRARAVAYLTMLRDEYPPFGEGPYAVELVLPPPEAPRDRITVAFRIFLALPHILVLWVLGIAWAITSLIAWFSIVFTGNYPPRLYEFGVGVMQWSARVECYLLLLRDEYPPFSLD